ncbi:PorT family protein [Dyadobacter chenwenxiniae]|uniref:PorT family protein n=1 Tax=Dyadobacter chenwenxiniae TaxID=2906456 RepID=A0A9X1TCX6_9BACT|nr:porin family protein [Dyadobacter chenwenxiniae]MCF0060597.1 PorT family protein [Dyadobacter chenwenxiniae]UON86328.1 PorT family protein [Dyadobacter chenwenxiniae]
MKTLAVSIFLLAICGSVFAQDIKIAPVLGPSVSIPMVSTEMRDLLTDIYDEDFETSSKSTFPPSLRLQAGALVDYGFNESLSLQTGLIFNLRGFKYKIKADYTDADGDRQKASGKATFSITYLEIPIWLSYRLGDTGFKIIAGPGFGFAIGGKAKSKMSVGDESESYSEKLDIGTDPDSDAVKPFDLNFNIGIAKEINLADRPLEISVFAQPSVTKWIPRSSAESDYFARHLSAGIRVAYFFQIK